jgi:hypothetical protein
MRLEGQYSAARSVPSLYGNSSKTAVTDRNRPFNAGFSAGRNIRRRATAS